jgi:LysR family transcriptional regulator, hydrogen peroxide-inducible genes activator
LRETKMLYEIINQQSMTLRGELKIGIIPSLAPYLLPLFLKKFMLSYPDIDLIINELTTDQLSINLKEGNVDVALLAIPFDNPDFRTQSLFYERFYYFGGITTKHQNKTYILPEEIKIDELLLLEEGHCMRSQVMNLCELRKKDHLKLKFEYQSGSIETLKRMVKSNMGCTILPELAIQDLSDEDQSRLIAFQEPVPVREIGLMTYRHYTKQHLITALKNSILESIPAQMKSVENRKVMEISV